MKRDTALFLLFSLAISSSQADSPPPGVTITLELSSTNIWPFEMVFASTVISNTTDSPVTRTAAALGATMIRNSNGQWKYSRSYGGGECSPPTPIEIVLPPHGFFEVYDLMATDGKGKSFFSQPGIHEMKSFSCFGESEIARVNVLPFPTKTDSRPMVPDTLTTLFDKTSFRAICRYERYFKKREFNPWVLPFMRELENVDQYADWLQLVGIWEAINDVEDKEGQPDHIADRCEALIDKYANHVVPKDRNPIPLVMAYVELARWQGRQDKREDAAQTLAKARATFADNPTLLCVLTWEGMNIPQTPAPPKPTIWW